MRAVLADTMEGMTTCSIGDLLKQGMFEAGAISGTSLLDAGFRSPNPGFDELRSSPLRVRPLL